MNISRLVRRCLRSTSPAPSLCTVPTVMASPSFMADALRLGSKRETAFDHFPEHVTNLIIGVPAKSMLRRCAAVVKEATAHRMDQSDAHNLFQYGPEIGDRRYREAVAKLLTEEYQEPVDVENIVATAGASQGLQIITQLLFSPGDIAFAENPTYFLGAQILRSDAQMKLIGVPLDDQGLIPEELEKLIEANKDYRPRELTERRPYWGILYLLSSFQNPCGMCLPPDRCKKVVEIARKHNLLVVSDDVYNLICHGRTPARLFSFDKPTDPGHCGGNTVSNGSFSKIFGPGMRLGWMEAPAKVRGIMLSSGVSGSGGGFNHTISGIMTSVIELGLLQSLLKDARSIYQAQCQALCGTLRDEIPSAEFTEPAGGFFVWMKLPGGLNGKELAEICKEKYDLIFCPGEVMSTDGSFKDHIRLAFCHYDVQTLKDATLRLSQAIKFMQSSKQ